MDKKLQKPHFVKVSTLENMRQGYNVYVKVVSVEKSVSQNGAFQIARAVVADDSGCANAFFKGDTVQHIKEGAVIAIRNGKIKLIKGHISLEIDLFGRITPEQEEIKANTTNNISEKEMNRKYNRRPNGFKNNENRRDENRRDGNRRDENRRDENRRDEKREHRREDRRDREDRKDREDKREDRRGRNNFKEEKRPKIEWTKIASVEPGEDNLNMTAKVISVEQIKNMCRVQLGDETAVVKAFIPNNEYLQVDETIVLFRCEAEVVKEHIEIQLMRSGKIDKAKNRSIEEVDKSVDISAKAWIESA